MDLLWAGVDSLYLVVVGDYSHLAELYSMHLEGASASQRREGVVIENNMLVRGGANGYCVSLWTGKDSRVFFSRVASMGIWVQLGPTWLRRYEGQWGSEVLRLLSDVGVMLDPGIEVRINRLDWALDLPVDIGELGLEMWAERWVGYASMSAAWFRKGGLETAEFDCPLETVNVGRPGGSAVRMRAYNKLVEAEKSNDLDFWVSCWGLSEKPQSVMRLEWSTFPYRGRFEVGGRRLMMLQDLDDITLGALVKYCTHVWGRLAVPGSDSNRSRWETDPLWKEVEEIADSLYEGAWKLVRNYAWSSYTLNRQYLELLAGWVSGALARMALYYGVDAPSGVVDMVRGLNLLCSDRDLQSRASEKLEKLLILGNQVHGSLIANPVRDALRALGGR